MKNGIALIVFALAFLNAGAQQPINTATVEELVDKLAPQETASRSMRNLAPVSRAIDLVIQFEFDSARLQEASKPLLTSLAQAMGTDRLKSLRFSVEGHTDAVGKVSYNQLLSEKRARTVLDFLQFNGVENDRLMAQGKGSSELLTPDKPEAVENRRVRITTLK